jgi:chromosomal replication initiator protein
MQTLWNSCAQELKRELPGPQYETWIKPLAMRSADPETGRVVIGAPNHFVAQWVKKQFLPRMESIATGLLNRPVEILITLDKLDKASKPGLAAPLSVDAGFAMAMPAQAMGSAASMPLPSPEKVDSMGISGRFSTLDQADPVPLTSISLTAASPAGMARRAGTPPMISQLANQQNGLGAGLAEGLAARSPTGLSTAYPNVATMTSPAPATGKSPRVGRKPIETPYDRTRLNPEYSFESFVRGKTNDMAYAAAQQVASNPGVSYNPLFVYSGAGLGKTHLLHAIGNALFAQHPGIAVRYIHAEQYVSDVIKAYQKKAFDDFKRYYHSLDVLLIDDIQFFSNKSGTQEQFFYAFNALIEQHKQVVITCDTFPKEIPGIEDRLTSRFGWGLNAFIDIPELDLRASILLTKAKAHGIELDESVAFFIAKHARSNVRELEGALKTLRAYAHFHGRELNVELAREALKDLISVQNRQISLENIQKTVAEYYRVKVQDLFSKKRTADIVKPRQVAMYLAKELTPLSYPEIGQGFGGRDHTTALHATRKITENRRTDPALNHALHVLEQTLKS